MKATVERTPREKRTRDGHQIAYDEFYASRSEPIIDDIDAVLARHYGFSLEEPDAVVNFDAKFRLGADDDES